MSYILEALRKADAERERGAVPDIHTQPLFAADRDDAPPRPRWVIPVLGTSVALLVAALAFVLLRGGDDAAATQAQGAAGQMAATPGAAAPGQVAATPPEGPVTAASRSTPPPPPVAAPRTPPPAASAAPSPQAPRTAATQPAPTPTTPKSATPPATTHAPPGPDGARSAPVPAPAAPAPRTAAPRDANDARTPPTAGSAASSAARKPAPEPAGSERRDTVAAATPAAAPTAAERVYATAELPDDVRRGLPTFTFGGAVYSDNAANRMLIINGQLFNEGGQPSPGVVLDQIRLKSAVFRYRGYRYEMPY